MRQHISGDPMSPTNLSEGLLPAILRPIVILGAGSIVRDAHLPAYRKAGFPVIGIADIQREIATQLQQQYGIERSFGSVSDAVRFAPRDAVFDLAVPASDLLVCLEHLPNGSAVLMQKPMGESLTEANQILKLCRRKKLVAAVNFQLRWSPNMVQARRLFEGGDLGAIDDFEVQVSCHTPWESWPFLAAAPRLEILYHSVHYIDLARAWLGDPIGVYAKTVRSPRSRTLAATKSVITLDYGDWTRAYIATGHDSNFGATHQRSFVQIAGSKAAIHAQMGVNLDYPKGTSDRLAVGLNGQEWRELALSGSWFPDAFYGSMGSIQRYLEGTSEVLPTTVEDAIHTMALVEAAYESSAEGGRPIRRLANL